MNLRYKSFLFVLSFVGSAFCMEQQIVKYEKRMPDHVRNMLDRSKKFKGHCNSSCGWCGSGPGLHREEKWRALICATYYEDSVSVKNLLEDKALDKNTLEYTQKDQLNIWSSIDTFPRLHVLPLTVALHTKNQDIIKLLQDKSDLQDTEMCPLYALAVYMGDVDLLGQCIKNDDFDPLYNDKAGGGLLQLAVRNGDDNMVERLLQLSDIKASINSWRFDCAPVLFIAAQRGFCGIATRLCEAGADPAKPYDYPHYRVVTLPISIAVRSKHAAMVKLLCELSVDIVNMPDKYGNTALHSAAFVGDEKTINVLLAVPTIKVDIKNESGKTPLDIVQEEDFHKSECLLWRWLDKNKSTQ
jgi:ankyrin repeat protein